MIYESYIKSFRHIQAYKTIQFELPKPFPESRLPKNSIYNPNSDIFQNSVMVSFSKCLENINTYINIYVNIYTNIYIYKYICIYMYTNIYIYI